MRNEKHEADDFLFQSSSLSAAPPLPIVSVVGAGRLGGALAIALAEKNYSIENLISRTRTSAERIARFIEPAPRVSTIAELDDLPPSDVVIIAVPDPEIETTARRLAAFEYKSATIFLHTSGSLSSEILHSLKEKGSVGSLHPLVSASDAAEGAKKFTKAYFCVEGDESAVVAAAKIAADLGGFSFELETNFKTLYHAAAVMAAGHVVALFEIAAETLARCGLSEGEAQRILLPLVGSVAENLRRQAPAAALTGTFARADAETMRRHLAALQSNGDKDVLRIYAALGLVSLRLAARQNADPERLAEMSQTLEQILKSAPVN